MWWEKYYFPIFWNGATYLKKLKKTKWTDQLVLKTLVLSFPARTTQRWILCGFKFCLLKNHMCLNGSIYLQNNYFVHSHIQSKEDPKQIDFFVSSSLLEGLHKLHMNFCLQQSSSKWNNYYLWSLMMKGVSSLVCNTLRSGLVTQVEIQNQLTWG